MLIVALVASLLLPTKALADLVESLVPGRCYTVVAPPGCGKTLFGLNTVAALLNQGASVTVAATEETSRYYDLLACRKAGISYAEFFYGRLGEEDLRLIRELRDEYARKSQLRLVPSPQPSVDEIFCTMERGIPDVLVIDYLQCLHRQGRALPDMLDWALPLLCEAADELGLVLIVLSQVHRPQGADALYAYRIPTLHSGQGSSRIEQKSDVVLALSRKLKDGIPRDTLNRLAKRLFEERESMRDYEEPNTIRVTCLKHRMDDDRARRSVLLSVHRGKLEDRLPPEAVPDWLPEDDRVPF